MSNDLRFRATMEDKVSATLDKLRDKFDLLGKNKGAQAILQGVGQGIGQAALKRTGDALAFVIDKVGESIDAASHMRETQSKVDVIFGKSADAIHAWGTTAAKSFGLSNQAAQEAAATFGNLFTNVGESQKDASDMSKTLVQLAGDLASFNDLDPTVALEKLRSGLAGESEPLRAVGVFLTEAKVKAKAMQLGLGDAHGELTEGEKILARYKLILDETGTAQGDFARTSEGLANQQRTANGELEDAKVRLGEAAIGWELFWTKAQIGALDFLAANPLEKVQSGIIAVNNAIFPFAKAGDTAAYSLRSVAKGAASTQTPLKNAAGGIKGVGDAAKTATPKVEDFLDAVFGPAQLQGEKAGKILEIADLKDQIAKIQDQKVISTADKLKLKELRGQLSGSREDLIKLEIKLAALGDKPSSDDLKKFLDARLRQTKTWNAELQTSYNLIASIAGVAPVGGNNPALPPGHSAEGGYVGLHGPELRWVGEQGPEYVVPNDKLGTMGGMGGGAPVVIQVVLPGIGMIAEAVDEHLYYGDSRASPSQGRK